MKRFWICPIILLVLLTGCKRQKPGILTLNISISLGEDEWKVMREKVFPPFEEKENVRIRAVNIEAQDTLKKIEAMHRANRMDIDLLFIDNMNLAPYVEKRLVLRLDQYPSASDLLLSEQGRDLQFRCICNDHHHSGDHHYLCPAKISEGRDDGRCSEIKGGFIMARILLKDFRKIYPNGFEAVHGINLEINEEEFMVLVGPSGCAKSTTLRMIAGLEDIAGGDLIIGDRCVNDLPPAERNVAMVFQDYALYPHMTIFDNMAYGLRIRRLPKSEIKKRVTKAAGILFDVDTGKIDDVIYEVRSELGKVMAKKHLTTSRLKDENSRHQELSSKVELAIQEKREDLAEAAIAKQLDIEAQVPILENTIRECIESEKKFEGFITALQAKKRQMQEEVEDQAGHYRASL